MKKKIYISLPIKIAEDTVHSRYQDALKYINENLKDYKAVGPINILDFKYDGIIVKRDHDYAWYMGEDIKLVINCDAILMCDGWETSDGCNCELSVAQVYKKNIFYKK